MLCYLMTIDYLESIKQNLSVKLQVQKLIQYTNLLTKNQNISKAKLMQKSFSKKSSSHNSGNSGNNSGSNSKLFQTNKSKQGNLLNPPVIALTSTGISEKARPLLKSETQKKVVKNLMVQFDSLPQSKEDSKEFRQKKRQNSKSIKKLSKQKRTNFNQSKGLNSLNNQDKIFEASKKSIIDSLNYPQLRTEEQSSQSPLSLQSSQKEINQQKQPNSALKSRQLRQLKSTKKKFQTQRQSKRQNKIQKQKPIISNQKVSNKIQTVKKVTNITNQNQNQNQNNQNLQNLNTKPKNDHFYEQLNNLQNYNQSYILPKSYILAMTALQQSILQKNNKLESLQQKLLNQEDLILQSQTKFNELFHLHQQKLSQLKQKQVQIKLLKNYLQQTQLKNQQSLKQLSKQFYKQSIYRNMNMTSNQKNSKDNNNNQKKQSQQQEKRKNNKDQNNDQNKSKNKGKNTSFQLQKSFNNNQKSFNNNLRSQHKEKFQNENHFQTFGHSQDSFQNQNRSCQYSYNKNNNNTNDFVLQQMKEQQLKLLRQARQLDQMEKQIKLNNQICLKANILSKQFQLQKLQNKMKENQEKNKSFIETNLRNSSKNRSQSHFLTNNKLKHVNLTERKQQKSRVDKNGYQYNQSLTNYKKIQADRYYNKMRSNSQSNFIKQPEQQSSSHKINLLSSTNRQNLNHKIHQNRQLVSHMRQVMRHEKELISLQYKMECIQKKLSESLSLKDQKDLLKKSNLSSQSKIFNNKAIISSSSSAIEFGIEQLKRQYGYLKRQIQKKKENEFDQYCKEQIRG